MAEIRHFPQSGFQATWETVARKVAPSGQPVVNADKYCVYNQTRGRFIATSVEAVDASAGGQEARLRSLAPAAGTGLWLFPCPEISPTSIRFLVDLVYLNGDGAVVAAVESFPLANAAVSSTMAGSVLVLAESTVSAGEIHIGDRLIIAAPDEMKRQLQSMKEAKAAAEEASASSLDQHSFSSPEVQTAHVEEKPAADSPSDSLLTPPAQPPADPVPGSPVSAVAEAPAPREPLAAAPDVAATVKPNPPSESTESAPSVPGAGEWRPAFLEPPQFLAAKTPRSAFEPLPAVVQQGAPIYDPTSPSQAVEPFVTPHVSEEHPPAKLNAAPPPSADPDAWKKKKQAKGWFARLLNPEPEDARITSRESLPGLIAYYFTGGTPQPHAVRDISVTGMYIVTEERWYPGTIVRVTLTDRHNPTTERSITVNAKAVRAGSDGVGFEFVLEERDRSKIRPEEWMDRANGMYVDEIQEFLRVYKST